MTDFKALEDRHDFSVYPKRDLVLVRGENAKVWDVHGREYIDCVAGHGVASIGHCNPRIVEALERQSRKPSPRACITVHNAPTATLSNHLELPDPA